MIYTIIPAYNEEKSITKVIEGIRREVSRPVEIVVVDDGSTDRTAELAWRAGATVLRHEVNRGQGAALQTGDEYARERGAEIVVHFDADGQLNPGDIESAVKLLRDEQADVVLGSRFLDSRTRLPWSKRRLVLPASRRINNLLAGIQLTDAHNGFRVFNKRALERVDIKQDGMAHNSEITAQIKRHGLVYKECPVEVHYYEYGQGVNGGFKILWDLLLGNFR